MSKEKNQKTIWRNKLTVEKNGEGSGGRAINNAQGERPYNQSLPQSKRENHRKEIEGKKQEPIGGRADDETQYAKFAHGFPVAHQRDSSASPPVARGQRDPLERPRGLGSPTTLRGT